MFRKLGTLLLIAALFLTTAPKDIHADAGQPILDKSSLSSGIIKVHYADSDHKALVRVTKGDVQVDYSLVNGASYPLQWGDGSYNVLVAKLISDNKYQVVLQENIDVKKVNEQAVFLQSISIANWNETTKAVVEAKKLTAAAATDEDKVKAIYTFLTKNYKYMESKTQTVEAGYIPDLDEIYDESGGICFDYAATFAAMARSVGIPTRLVMGYEVHAPDMYHAWNQVFLKDLNEWGIIDTTYDASRVQNGQPTTMIKNSADYVVTCIY
ncbi:transglutaminase-like domain-containing protein [Paenibacillus sp. RC67]|uniref:transglutaminase-like domain-containing protein n=1 Tax=Paenibacillus sp. RC67 TaxID=3039392 RepID=UPI0024AD9E4B|nr:transglutaminase-like domain-containing protein [Paenibacillus sp. RC67]